MIPAGYVLVVDDDQSIRELVYMALGEEGYKVIGAPDGNSALDVVREGSPNLILLDMRMPDMDGWEFCRAYRQTPEPHAPIIILTAAQEFYNFTGHIRVDAFLAKPFELDHLLKLVERHIHRG